LSKRVIGLMKPCEARRGVIFVSHDGSGNQAVKSLAKHLSRTVIAFNFARKAPRQREFEDKLAFLEDPNVGLSLFKSPPKNPCVIVAGLDHGPKWLLAALKRLMDHQKVRPFNCLATAATLDKLPDSLTSHFFTCRKIGRPKLL